MADAKNKYIGMSKEELEMEQRTLYARLFAEQQKKIKKDDLITLRRSAAYIRNIQYNITKVYEAQMKLQQQKKTPVVPGDPSEDPRA